MKTIKEPWVPFEDFKEHVTITLPVMNIHPTVEYNRAMFAENQALGMLLAISEKSLSSTEQMRCAVCLAKLSAKVLVRRNLILGVIEGEVPIPKEVVEQLEKASYMYWIIAQMANLLDLMPTLKAALEWAVTEANKPPRVSEKKAICSPWRSPELTDAMRKHYAAREMFSFKLWEARFPNWMKSGVVINKEPKKDKDQKTPDDQA